MEKLLKLLNEYSPDYCKDYPDDIIMDEIVISKRFGFIKRLVDNDKIDKRKIDTRLVRHVDSHYDEAGYWVENSYEDYSDTNTLLMLLAISDTPIYDLISYLR